MFPLGQDRTRKNKKNIPGRVRKIGISKRKKRKRQRVSRKKNRH